MKILIYSLFLFSSLMAEGVWLTGGTLSSVTACGDKVCGSVSMEADIDPAFLPVNNDVEHQREGYFFYNNFTKQGDFYSQFFVNGSNIIPVNKDSLVALYSTSGFYILTKKFGETFGDNYTEGGTAVLSNIVVDYDVNEAKVTVTFDYEKDEFDNGVTIRSAWGLYMNIDQAIDDNLTAWRVDPVSRRVIVNSSVALDRIDLHGTFGGVEYNYALTEIFENTWAWDILPTIGDDEEVSLFFNYDVGGVGHDSPVVTGNTGDLAEIFTVTVAQDFISINDQPNFDQVETAYVHYQINGGPMQNYQMERRIIFQDAFRTVTGLAHDFASPFNVGDVIEYSFTYTYKGWPYTTPRVTKTQQ